MKKDLLRVFGSKSDLYVSYDDLLGLAGIEAGTKPTTTVSQLVVELPGIEVKLVKRCDVAKAVPQPEWIKVWFESMIDEVYRTGAYVERFRDPVPVLVSLKNRLAHHLNWTELRGKRGLYITHDVPNNTYTFDWSDSIAKACKHACVNGVEFIDAYEIDECYELIYKKALNTLAFDYIDTDRDQIALVCGIYINKAEHPQYGYRCTIGCKPPYYSPTYDRLIDTYVWTITAKIVRIDELMCLCDELHTEYKRSITKFIDERETIYEAHKKQWRVDKELLENAFKCITNYAPAYSINVGMEFEQGGPQVYGYPDGIQVTFCGYKSAPTGTSLRSCIDTMKGPIYYATKMLDDRVDQLIESAEASRPLAEEGRMCAFALQLGHKCATSTCIKVGRCMRTG